MSEIYDNRACELGEGPLWHPLRNQLFWFDINGKRLHCDDGQTWQFDEHVSAAGWINATEFLVASETALLRFDIESGAKSEICSLEADDPETRSNDGRADPWGGFWIGTMHKEAANAGGAIYRFYEGELRQLFAPISITNAIAFAPDRSCAYCADTAAQKVFRTALDAQGWPTSAPTVFLDLVEGDLNPDGSIVAADGSYLNAQWGASRVARYDATGAFLDAYDFPTSHITCPALGGPNLSTLFATSAQQGMDDAQLTREPDAGKTFSLETSINGLPEYQVKL